MLLVCGAMQRSDFHYCLPTELIARYPPGRRTDSRLLYCDPRNGALENYPFSALPELLGPDDLLVFNDSQVIPARLLGHKAGGARIEILVERILEPHRARALLGSNRPLRSGTQIHLADGAQCEVQRGAGALSTLRLRGADSFQSLLEQHGQVPLPPYLGRDPEPQDRERYQTVYARHPGAVAAPTAGLHFSTELLQRIEAGGTHCAYLTLHVGLGTFQPIRSTQVQTHRMHRERFQVSAELCARVCDTRRRGGRVIAVGTTSARALETAGQEGALRACRGETGLYIYPGYRFRVIDALLTNFHLSESSLLVLVSAFAGREALLHAYRYAIAQRYRFYSYGDAMLIARPPGPTHPAGLTPRTPN